jgi:DNA invertase Pin-like site-specific DNA recombinase
LPPEHVPYLVLLTVLFCPFYVVTPTQAGLNAARARGRKGGRPKVLEPAKRQLVVKLYAEKKHTIGEICRMMGISKPTLYNYVAEASA